MINTSLKIGDPYQGGFLAGYFTSESKKYALIVAPKEEGECVYKLQWKKTTTNTSDIEGYNNSYASLNQNTPTLPAISYCLGLTIGGYKDWYLPSKNELEICYRNLKPTSDNNYTGKDVYGYLNGKNINSVPEGIEYSLYNPVQTTLNDFKSGGSQSFNTSWYWSSTAYDSKYSWCQHFRDGDQVVAGQDGSVYVRAVRRVELE